MTNTAPAAKLRLFVETALQPGVMLDLPPAVGHYLGTVMRRRPGDAAAVFNGRDGEWVAVIEAVDRRGCRLSVGQRLQPQRPERGPSLLFAPLKRAPLDFLIGKATELGVARFAPVVTRRTVIERLRPERLRAIAIEAAEQCGRLTVPAIDPPRPLAECCRTWPPDRPLYVGDETGGGAPVLAAFARHGPGDLLIGPEGGFHPAERAALRGLAMVVPIDLGPRILRAETAGLAALACWQAQFAPRSPEVHAG